MKTCVAIVLSLAWGTLGCDDTAPSSSDTETESTTDSTTDTETDSEQSDTQSESDGDTSDDIDTMDSEEPVYPERLAFAEYFCERIKECDSLTYEAFGGDEFCASDYYQFSFEPDECPTFSEDNADSCQNEVSSFSCSDVLTANIEITTRGPYVVWPESCQAMCTQ